VLKPHAAVLVGIRRVVALLLTVLFFVYLWSIRRGFLDALQALRGSQVFTISGLLILHWGLRAWRDRFLFAEEGHALRVRDLMWLNSLQLALNYLPLKAGTLSSAGLMLGRFGVGIQSFGVVLVQQYALNALASSALAAGAIWFSTSVEGVGASATALFFLVAAGGSFGLLRWEGPARLLPQRVTERLLGGSVLRLAVLRRRASMVVPILVLTVSLCLVSSLRMMVVFGIVTGGVDFADALVISASVMLSPLLAITPAGLGITESLVGLAAMLVGQPGQAGVLAATIDRAVVLVLTIVVGACFAPLTWSRGRDA
jgi:hypothetical protein